MRIETCRKKQRITLGNTERESDRMIKTKNSIIEGDRRKKTKNNIRIE